MPSFTELLVTNLAGGFPERTREYMPKEEAYERLKSLSGEDFGYDVKKWRAWLRSQRGKNLFANTKTQRNEFLC